MLEAQNAIQSLRGHLGGYLDLVQRQIPQHLRWRKDDDTPYAFRLDCSDPRTLPPGLKP